MVPGLDGCGAGFVLPELSSSTARAGVMNVGVGKVHLAVHEVLKEEPQEGRTAPCGFPLAVPSPSGSFLPLRSALLIPCKWCSAGTSCSPKAITAFPW